MYFFLGLNSQQMGEFGSRNVAAATIAVLLLFLGFGGSEGIRFEILKDECLAHRVEFAKDTVRVLFVVVKADSPRHSGAASVDLLVKGPSGEHILYYRDQTDGKFEFVAGTKGLYKFCFWNKSPYKETVYFDAYDDHHLSRRPPVQAVEDVNVLPLKEEIAKLEQALNHIQFLQHWLDAQTDHTEIVNEEMSRRVIYKSMVESAGLIGSSLLQIFLLRLLFNRKMGAYRL